MEQDGNEDLITIYESKDYIDADFYRVSLKDYGFDLHDASRDINLSDSPYATAVMLYEFRVPRSQAERAKKFIHELANSKINESEMT